MKKRLALLLTLLVTLTATFASPQPAYAIGDTPLPNMPTANNFILAIAPDGTGGAYIGGAFTQLTPAGGGPAVNRNYIAHIKSDGTIDAAWNPSANLWVYALAVSGNTVYVGGIFTAIGGQWRNNIAALDATTGSATVWNPNANDTVRALAVSGSTVYAGGGFNNIGGQGRNHIAALDATTGLATAWNPNADDRVRALAVSGSTVYAGGDFNNIGGQGRNHIAALDADTGFATAWWNPDANGSVYALAVSGITVYAGGNFNLIGGLVRNGIAALGVVGTATAWWNPDANGNVEALAVSGSTVYAGGGFTSIGGQARNRIAALATTTGNATTWNPNMNDTVLALAVSGDTLYAGGFFTTIGGVSRPYFAAFGGLDTTPPVLTSFTSQTPATSLTNADTLVFRATFNEAVLNVNAADFTVSGTTATVSGVAGVGAGPTYTQYDITVSGGNLASLNGTVGLNLAVGQNITDWASNALPTTEPATDQTYEVNNTAPTLTSFTRQTPVTSPTNADTLVFRATFSEDVQNVNATDFTVSGTTAGLSVATVSTSVYDITVTGGDLANLNGTVGLNLAVGQNITDWASNALPTTEPATDQTYEVNNTAPTLTSFTRQTPATSLTNADTLVFRATFSEAVLNVNAADFTVSGTTATVSGVAGVGAGPTYTQYDITVSGGNLASLNGTVGLNLAAGQNITDLLGNALPTTEPATDETYEVNNAAPSVASQTLQSTYTGTGPSSFTVTFSENVNNAGSGALTDDAANPNNYVVMEQGAVSGFQTTACNAIDAAQDTPVTPSGVTYIPNTAVVNFGSPLPLGRYRLFVCGTTSIVDLAGNHLNNGVDSTFDFTVSASASGGGSSGNGSDGSGEKWLPYTGFAPSVVTRLPAQPAELAYTKMSDLWLEIPSQKVKANIVGVPQSANAWDVKWLGNDAGWLNGTAFPSWEGNSVLTAHVMGADGLPGPFAKLQNLNYGERVIVHMLDQQYMFEIRNKRLVRPDSTAFAFEHLEDASYLTLITCSGYNEEKNTYSFRRLIRAVLVEVK
jgi:LPXTG-site transpeptidase (sortase) family protein